VQTRLHSGDLSFPDFVRANKLDFSRDIVKEPSLTFLYEPLRSRFPDARFVMIVRDPRANIRSILNRLSLPGDMEDVRAPDLDGVSPEWQKVLDSRWLGVEGATYIDQLAGRWCLAADAYLQHRGEMLLIRYEDFEADKPGTIAQLAKTLGLPARHDVGAQADRQFQPRGNRSVSWREFFGARNLDRIERICGEQMEMLGYSPRST
jgi:hypothetical protein